MRLDEVATVRTGAVTGRKKAEEGMRSSFRYKMLNLKCIAAEGYIDLAFAEEYQAKEKLKPELFTQEGDVLIRLSFPYTSVLIDDNSCGLVVPSHFAVKAPINKSCKTAVAARLLARSAPALSVR